MKMIVIFVLLCSSPAIADVPVALDYLAGATLYEQGSYEAALPYFERVGAALHDPALLWNLALVHFRLDNIYMSRAYLRQYIRRVFSGAREPWPSSVERLASEIVRRLDLVPDQIGLDGAALSGL